MSFKCQAPVYVCIYIYICRRWNVGESILPEGGSGETNHHDIVCK